MHGLSSLKDLPVVNKILKTSKVDNFTLDYLFLTGVLDITLTATVKHM